MPLSIIKLEKLLNSSGLLIRSIFTISEQAVYLDLFHVSSADNFFLYVPSKYEITVSNNTNLNGRGNVFPLTYIEEKEFLTKVNDYELDKEYNKIDTYLSPEKQTITDMEKTLQENYEQDVVLQDLSQEDTENVKDIFDQISRLKFCVKNIKYKLAIMSRNHLGCVRRDNDTEFFVVSRYKGVDKKKIFIIVDLETLFADTVNVPKDIKSVRDGVNKILSQNQLKHTRMLSALLERKTDISSSSETIYKKKLLIDEYLKYLDILLKRTTDSETEKLEQIASIKSNERSGVIGLTSMQSDIERSHEIHKLDKELDHILDLKNDIVSDIIHLRTTQEDIALQIDKYLFQNTLYIHKLNSNFDKLIKIEF